MCMQNDVTGSEKEVLYSVAVLKFEETPITIIYYYYVINLLHPVVLLDPNFNLISQVVDFKVRTCNCKRSLFLIQSQDT